MWLLILNKHIPLLVWYESARRRSENWLVSENHQWSRNSLCDKSKMSCFSDLVKYLNLVGVVLPLRSSDTQQAASNHKIHKQEHLTPHMQPAAPSCCFFTPKVITEGSEMFLTHSCPIAVSYPWLTPLPASCMKTRNILTSCFSAFCFAGVAFFLQHWGAFGGFGRPALFVSPSTFSRVHRDLGGYPKLHVQAIVQCLLCLWRDD